jgi:hypothetical protein
MSLQVADNIAEFVRRIPGIQRDRKIMQPDLGFFVACTDMDMRRLAGFIGTDPSEEPSASTSTLRPSFEARYARTSG